MAKDPKLPKGVALIPTTIVRAKHTVLTEILNGTILKRLAITEPSANLNRRMHRHLRRDDYIYLLSGNVTVTTYDGKNYARIPMAARRNVVKVGRGIWHGYETGAEKAIVIEASTEPFDPTDVEEFQGEEPI